MSRWNLDMSRIDWIRVGVGTACFLTSAVVSSVRAFAPPADGTIGVYADSAGTQSCVTVDQFAMLYVIAKVAGATGSGITGAEFRIQVENPSGWSFSYSPPDAAISMGNPMDLNPDKPNESGLNIAFSTCRAPVKGMIGLGTIFVTREGGAPTHLWVRSHRKPSNPGYPCALFTLCDDPVFSKTCVTTSRDSCGRQETAAPDAGAFVTLNFDPHARRERLTGTQVVEFLRSERKTPVSFILAEGERQVGIALGGTVDEILGDLIAADPHYRLRSVNGHLVVYPAASIYDQTVVVPKAEFENLPWFKAAQGYTRWLAGHVPGFEKLVPQKFNEDLATKIPASAIEYVTLTPKATMVEHLAQLLGAYPRRVFTVAPAASGTPTLSFRVVVEATAKR